MSDYSIPDDLKKKLEEVEQIKAKAEAAKNKDKDTGVSFPDIKVADEDLLAFWDKLLKKEPYTETVKIRNLDVVIGTRSMSELNDIRLAVDLSTFNLTETVAQYHFELLLASAIRKVGDKLLVGGVKDRLEQLRTYPMPLISLISSKVDHFDKKIIKMTEMLDRGNF